jgi:Rrf2 family transcriptional regulator, nitric oxide-sensitive transcriptional repressor
MKLSQTGEYALRAVVWLADHGGAPLTTAELSSGTCIPPGYLSKVMQTLARQDLVRTQRGPGGGFTLVRPPDELSILDVINAVDPLKPIERCPLGYGSHTPGLCPLHTRLQQALVLIEKVFRDTKISDLLSTSAQKSCLCVEHR